MFIVQMLYDVFLLRYMFLEGYAYFKSLNDETQLKN